MKIKAIVDDERDVGLQNECNERLAEEYDAAAQRSNPYHIDSAPCRGGSGNKGKDSGKRYLGCGKNSGKRHYSQCYIRNVI